MPDNYNIIVLQLLFFLTALLPFGQYMYIAFALHYAYAAVASAQTVKLYYRGSARRVVHGRHFPRHLFLRFFLDFQNSIADGI